MIPLSRALVGFLALGLASPLIQAGGSQAVVPKEWLNKWRNSPFDLNNNQVDDVLEALPPSQQVELFIDLTGCFSAADRTRLGVFGTIDFESRYFPMIHMNGVLVSSLVQLAKDPIVAFIEEDSFMYHTLSISNPSIQVKASLAYPPPAPPAAPITVREKFPGIRGNSIMAVVDSGIDNQGANPAPTHQALPRFDGGMRCQRASIFALGCTQDVDPDDTTGTGTHAAAIAVGQGEGVDLAHEGIAPEEGLWDVYIQPDATILPPRFGFRKSLLAVALEGIAAKIDLNPTAAPKIVLIPWATCRRGDPVDGISNAINSLTNLKKVLVVTSMGNCSTCLGVPGSACTSCPCSVLTSPAAAESALTVGASSNAAPPPSPPPPRTVTRADDSLTGDNLIDPRVPPLKPDLVAPGVDIESADHTTTNGYVAKSGSSLAAAHVAGCAALALQVVTGVEFNSRALKQLLIDTAEDHGPPGWDVSWGAGALNCFAAVDKLNSGLCADLHFDGVCGGFMQPPCFFHPGVHPKEWLVEGVEDTIYVEIKNDGPGFADPYKVHLRADCFSNGDNGYDICDIDMPVLAPGATAQGFCKWTPAISGGAPGIVHAALFGSVVYDRDCLLGGYNSVRHNEDVRQSFSPAVVAMSVENQTTQTLTMELHGTFDCGGGPCAGWAFSPSSNFFSLTPDDCSPTVLLQATPGPGAVRDAKIHVSVIGHEAGGGTQDLSGVTMLARLACPTSNLRFSNKTTFTWSGPTGFSACPTSSFDVARGSLPIPKFNSVTQRGDFSSAICLTNEVSVAQYSDSTPLSPGSGFYYLTRAGSSAPGSWDVHDAKQKGLADETLKGCP